MITLSIVRHGETDWNIQQRYQGHSDIPLNETGHQHAAEIAARLADERLDVVISSDLTRAMQTAETIARPHGLTVLPEPGLREANFGVFEGLRYADIITQHKAMAEAWFADPEQPPDGGEKLSEVAERVGAVYTRLLAQHANQHMLVVGHSGALRLLLCTLLDMPPTAYWRFNLSACSLSRVNVYPAGAILSFLNDTAHLKEAKRT